MLHVVRTILSISLKMHLTSFKHVWDYREAFGPYRHRPFVECLLSSLLLVMFVGPSQEYAIAVRRQGMRVDAVEFQQLSDVAGHLVSEDKGSSTTC